MRRHSSSKRSRHRYAIGACLALLAGCAPLSGDSPAGGTLAAHGQLDPAQFARIDAAIGAAIAERRLPGAVFHLERGGAVHERAYGQFSYESGAAAVTPDSVFDAASLTKVLATAPAVLLLVEEGKLELDAKLVDYFPECGGGGKEAITIRHLLTHTSGLPAGLPARPSWQGDAAAHALACAQTVTHAPGSFFRYSDINYILLGQLVAHLSGEPLDAYAQRHIFTPLGMRDTGYLPLRRMAASSIVPTHRAPRRWRRGRCTRGRARRRAAAGRGARPDRAPHRRCRRFGRRVQHRARPGPFCAHAAGRRRAGGCACCRPGACAC
ncbi:serine hydrolase domain-containing protein [Massilia sp. Dwa41.01b]|uniref:serine hydrolase domain-containing protein n=1 Tax=Massilia sp. Dwa41.01b TaxID=2709302 RepID=UPI0028060B8A|nr:serine hydrolase domain-containing protein [Massilia sp. Dwa41.01b]